MRGRERRGSSEGSPVATEVAMRGGSAMGRRGGKGVDAKWAGEVRCGCWYSGVGDGTHMGGGSCRE